MGRMPWSSNATFLVEACHDGATSRAASTSPTGASGRCGTSPAGLYKREVAAYELAAGTRLGPRAAHRAAATRARSARARCSASSTPTSSSTTSRIQDDETPPARPSTASASSTSWPTTPTARAATCLHRRGRPHLGHRQRPVLPRRSSSCAPSSGSSAASRIPTDSSTTSRRLLDAACPRPRRPARHLRARRRAHPGPRRPRRGPLPPSTTPAAATPGPSSDHHTTQMRPR